MSRRAISKELNTEALNNPQPGDYWQEMFNPYFLVLRVIGDNIVIVDKRKDVGKDYWAWDIDAWKVVDRAYISSKVRYSTIDGFCADVLRDRHKPFIEAFNEMNPYTDIIDVRTEQRGVSFTEVMDMGI